MKEIVIIGIRWYQAFIAFPLRILTGATYACKFSPTCSEYAVLSIGKYGTIKGGVKALGRLFSCQPFVRT